MRFYDVMIDKLTDVFQKTKDSNIGRLFSVISKQLDELDSTYNRMDLWRDIDNAEGSHLDRLGISIVQEFRRGQTDEQYRLRIKTKIIANLSKGDIETINNVLTTFLGDSFVGVREMWSLDDPLIPQEPAGILITTETHRPFPRGVIGRVTAGGVAIYWHIILQPKQVVLQREINHGKSEDYVNAGQLYCGPIYDANTEGSVDSSVIDIASEQPKGEYNYPDLPNYSGVITDSTTGNSYENLLTVIQMNEEGYPEIVYSGEDWSEGTADEKYTTVEQKEPSGISEYQRSGKLYPGKEG